MLTPITDTDVHVVTRTAWHTLAERVLAPARHAATGHIGLRAAPGGFTTGDLGDGRSIAVAGTELVVTSAAETRRAPISTLGAAATFVGVEPDADTGVYTATTSADPATVLRVDPGAAAALAEWFAFGVDVLSAWAESHASESPSAVQLWPEHFDLGTDLGPETGRANYGASPGDAGHELPYLYVGPWDASDDPFWSAGTFARLDHETLSGVADPAAAATDFFRRGHDVAARAKS